jgi:hypothetical protein
MKSLVPMPPETAAELKLQEETGIGYQVVSDQVVVSEGCIIAVKDFAVVPFRFDEVETVTVNHKRWNFRTWSDQGRRQLKTSTADA